MRHLTIVNLIDIKKVSINNTNDGIPGIYIELPNDRFIMFTEKAFDDVLTQINKIREKQNEQGTD